MQTNTADKIDVFWKQGDLVLAYRIAVLANVFILKKVTNLCGTIPDNRGHQQVYTSSRFDKFK